MRYSILFSLLNLPAELGDAERYLPRFDFTIYAHDYESAFRHMQLAAESGNVVDW